MVGKTALNKEMKHLNGAYFRTITDNSIEMKIYYTIILMFLFQTAMGQTMSDSIVFHGKIVNDGILYNIGFILRIKNNPKLVAQL